MALYTPQVRRINSAKDVHCSFEQLEISSNALLALKSPPAQQITSASSSRAGHSGRRCNVDSPSGHGRRESRTLYEREEPELIQTHMAQKPMLRVEVCTRCEEGNLRHSFDINYSCCATQRRAPGSLQQQILRANTKLKVRPLYVDPGFALLAAHAFASRRAQLLREVSRKNILKAVLYLRVVCLNLQRRLYSMASLCVEHGVIWW
jgi:hypothetical protein